MPCLRTSRRSLASTKWSDPACCIGSSAKCSGAMMSLTSGVVRDKSARLYPRLRRGLATRPRTRIHGLSYGEGILRSAREGLPAAMAFTEVVTTPRK